MGMSISDAAELVARLEANGTRQRAEVHATLAEVGKAERGAAPAGRSKYGNVRCAVDGIAFDSQAEARRYGELRLLERAGAIRDLRPSPGQPKKRRFRLAGGITYTPDFTYTRLTDGREVAEDVKGGKATQTDHFRDKAKLFREAHPAIELIIVEG